MNISYFLGLFILFFHFSSSAYEFCERDHYNFLAQEENRLSFLNSEKYDYDEDSGKLTRNKSMPRAGVFGIGNCWWHTRFQIKSSIVASFNDPEGITVKTLADAKNIVNSIIHGKTVQIKNFKNLKEFSQEYEYVIRKKLNSWQLKDTLKFRWLSGLKGKDEKESNELFERVEEIYQDFKEANIPLFHILQAPGLNAHAWFILDIKHNIYDESYIITAIDSLYPFPVTSTVRKNSSKTFMSYDMENFFVSRDNPEYEIRKQYFMINVNFIPQTIKWVNKDIEKAMKRRNNFCELEYGND